LERWFESAHLFVLPGTGGLAAQQALGYGLPIIVAEGDGSQEAFVSEHNGWQIKPNDVNALQLALREALSDPERLKKMGEESYRVAKEEVNIEKMVESFLNAITTIKLKS
jgi:glycosyltransferase involved in cell wall biosynthesis